jgi:small redox-active disulfide protein 2
MNKMGLFSKKESKACCCGDVETLIGKENKEGITKDSDCGCGSGCDCGNDSTKEITSEPGTVIKILGSGCKNCITLADNVKKALEEMELEALIVKVTDFADITGYGVMSTPALVVNEKVVSYGKVLKPQEVIKILEKVVQ